jgi:hypothetical protein
MQTILVTRQCFSLFFHFNSTFRSFIFTSSFLVAMSVPASCTSVQYSEMDHDDLQMQPIIHNHLIFLSSADFSVSLIQKNLFMRFEVPTVMMLMLVFWVMTPCGLTGDYQHFGGTHCLYRQHFSPEDGDSIFLANVGINLQVHTALPTSTNVLCTHFINYIMQLFVY